MNVSVQKEEMKNETICIENPKVPSVYCKFVT